MKKSENIFEVVFRADGIEAEYHVPVERLDDVLRLADERFLPPMTSEDLRRFRAILRADGKRRASNG